MPYNETIPMKGIVMDQIEFFDAVKTKKMKEATITLDCDCQIIYSAVTKETFVKTCPTHSRIV